MRPSQPFHQLFTIALSGPGQAGPEVLTREERLEYDALPYDVQRRRDWLAGRLAAKGSAAQRFCIARLDNVRIETRTRQAPGALIGGAGNWKPLPATVSLSPTPRWRTA